MMKSRPSCKHENTSYSVSYDHMELKCNLCGRILASRGKQARRGRRPKEQ